MTSKINDREHGLLFVNLEFELPDLKSSLTIHMPTDGKADSLIGQKCLIKYNFFDAQTSSLLLSYSLQDLQHSSLNAFSIIKITYTFPVS